ncbi:MAG TPA: hypothetical protein VGH38_19910 [Bryobacteraceae bacterium]
MQDALNSTDLTEFDRLSRELDRTQVWETGTQAAIDRHLNNVHGHADAGYSGGIRHSRP